MSRAKIVIFVMVAVVVGGAIAAAWYIASRGFSARTKPSSVETFVARRLRRFATDPAMKAKANPVTPTDLAIAEARDHFADHCAMCHANDGSGQTMMGANMYPPAPDMRGKDTQDLTDGEIFSIIRDGIRFTGMPGWGGEDEENWKLVLFIRHLPHLSAKERELMNEVNHLDGSMPVEGHGQKH
jgi:mono/diheme cytochrome c family protein